MSVRLEFYRDLAGREPALDYVRSQTKAHRAKIGRALQYLENMGHLARRPLVDYLGDEIYELRVALDQHQHRLLYFFSGQKIVVVTSGVLKNTGKVPRAEIERAKARRADWLTRFGGKP